MTDDELKCNICGITISLSQVMQHVSSPSHVKRRTELKHETEAVTKENYKNDLSVIAQWEGSLTILQ